MTTRLEHWEKKEISPFESKYSDCEGDTSIIAIERDWLLGGQNLEWRYYKDPIRGVLVLERR
jgi:hypothetical protein